jgi:tetratricopeptide (TPR) repeat protein
MAVDIRLLKQLNHSDPKLRRKAIVALADCRDVAGLKPLETTAESDPDPKLRELAVKAASHLKEQVEKALAYAASPEAQPIRVSEKQMARSREYMNEAMSMMVAKDNAKAIKALAKALQIDPSLKEDNYFQSLAGNLFNTNPDEAIKKLTSGEARGEHIKAQEQGKIKKRKDDHTAKAREIGWASVAFDLAIYAVVAAVIAFFAPLVYSQLISRTVAYQEALTPAKYAEETVKISPELGQSMAKVQAGGIGPFILPALLNGLASGAFMLALGWLIHQLATRVFKGHGTMPYMMSQLVPFYSLMMPVFFIWSCIVMGMISIGAGLIGLLCLPLMALASIVVFFKSAGRIGDSYDFGAAKGCLSLVIGSVALSLVGGILSAALFGAAINSAMLSLGLS